MSEMPAEIMTSLQRAEMRRMADDAEAERVRLNWPYLFRVTDHVGLDRAVVTVASYHHNPCAALLPLDEAVALRGALDWVIASMQKRAGGPPCVRSS